MKKIYILIAILAAAVSCSKEQPKGDEAQLTPLTFTAVSEQTKTSLDGQAVIWSTTDHVMVFASADYDTPYDFSVTSTANGGKQATIEGMGTVSPEYFALFPYQADAICNGAEVTLTIPTDQAAVAGSFGPAANPAVAHITGTEDLLFKNVGALLAVNIQATDVTGLKVESLDGTEMTGPAQFDCIGSAPVLNDFQGGQGKSYVQTTVSGAGVYYLVVAPGDYTGGFRLTFTKSGYKAVVENTKALTVERNDNVNLFTTPATIPWEAEFTPGDRVFIKGLSIAGENGQELSYITADYYNPRPGGTAPGSPARGDEASLAGITYNYEVWAKIAPSDNVYFESENGARFAISNGEGTAVGRIAATGTGNSIAVSEDVYRIRLNLPSGDAQIARVSIVNFGIMYGDVSQNLNYDQAGAWKIDNYVFSYSTNQSWDSTNHRYLISVWFTWKGGHGGSNLDQWQRYGTLNQYTDVYGATTGPDDDYYYLQPFAGYDWGMIFYMPKDVLFPGMVNQSKKGTLSVYFNNTYGHFTHGFSNIVDNS